MTILSFSSSIVKMIANISTILYVLSILTNKILQRGTAACKTDSDGGFLTFLYTLWLPLDNDEFGDSDTKDSYIQKFHQNSVYFVTGKFTMLANGSLELVISSCKDLQIHKEEVPVVNLSLSVRSCKRGM